MASLQAVTFAGVAHFNGDLVQIPDGPPTAVVNISSGASGALPGGTGAPKLVKLEPIGGVVDVTWPNNVVERIAESSFRWLRGESVAVTTGS